MTKVVPCGVPHTRTSGPGTETGRETGREKREGRHHLHGVGLLVRTSGAMLLVREGGVEPPRPFGHWNLNPARLPIPPPAHWVCSGPSHFSVGAPGDIRRLARRRPWIHIRCFDSARGDQGDQGEGVTGGRTGVGRSEREPEAGGERGPRGQKKPSGRAPGRRGEPIRRRSRAKESRGEREAGERGRTADGPWTDHRQRADRGRAEGGRQGTGQGRAESRTRSGRTEARNGSAERGTAGGTRTDRPHLGPRPQLPQPGAGHCPQAASTIRGGNL